MRHSHKKFRDLFLPCLFLFLLVGPASPPALALEKAVQNSLGMEFVLIPAGTFTMGSPQTEANRDRGEVQHRVTLTRPFYMQTTEVTLRQWRRIMGKRILGLISNTALPSRGSIEMMLK